MQVYWGAFADAYHNLGPPLKPSAEDVEVVEGALEQWRRERPARELNALLCGVTPAFANLNFPAGTRLLAAEQSEPMIRALWPGDNATRMAVRGNWLELPRADHTCDIVLGDGCFQCMAYPGGHRALLASMHRVLVSDGIVLMRFFVRPSVREDIDSLFADLHAAKISSFHVFKWRLAMALQSSTEAGIVVNEIYEAWAARGIRSTDLATKLGWPVAAIDTITAYQGKGTRFSFSTLEEIRAVVQEHFDEIFVREPGYDLGERCPMFALSPR
jgi:SAM-dependent methyltransferase